MANQKNTTKIIAVIVALVIVGAGSFYGGMQYAKNAAAASRGAFANLTAAERQARFQSGGGQVRGGANGAGFIAGEIMAKDDKSLTLKLLDGGSKIIFFSPSTPVTKSAEGSAADLAVGDQVTANGTANQDGSISAQMIQIRPNTPPPTQPR